MTQTTPTPEQIADEAKRAAAYLRGRADDVSNNKFIAALIEALAAQLAGARVSEASALEMQVHLQEAMAVETERADQAEAALATARDVAVGDVCKIAAELIRDPDEYYKLLKTSQALKSTPAPVTPSPGFLTETATIPQRVWDNLTRAPAEADGWRVRIKDGCLDAGRLGTALAEVQCDQRWTVVRWDEIIGDENGDPDLCKSSCLDRLPSPPTAREGE